MNRTTISARFETGDREYTFMVPRELADELEVGDSVVVDTTAGLRVVTVSAVHARDQRMPGSGIQYKWAFQKVNVDYLGMLLAEDTAESFLD